MPDLPVAEQYAVDVISGAVPACKWVRLACERHLRDLEMGEERGLYFDSVAGQYAIDFFQFLRHSKGEWAGQVVALEPWQQFITWNLFGWMRPGDVRRFRTGYVEVARKNGKTTWAAGVGLELMTVDGEPGAEIYTAATKRDQARLAHSEATRMVKASPSLRRRIGIYKDNLHIVATSAKFEPLGADADTTDGLNVQAAIVDELHAHKTRDMWDVIDTATGARRQPMILAITTAGMDRTGICWEQHEYTEKVLDGVLEDDSHFGIIYTLDENDDWADEANWIKANPNLGVSKKWDDMRSKALRAKETPAALNGFLRKELNVWTMGETRWMAPDKWQACAGPVDGDGLRGRSCYAGLDLSTTTDISAFVLVFPPATSGDPYSVICRFWVPADNVIERVRRDRVPYDAWIRQGYIQATPGSVIDYAFILAELDELAAKYDLREIAFDRWGATKLQTEMMEHGHEIVQFGQGYASMSAPMKELEKLIISQQLAHGGNPVLGWMAANVVASEDPAGNIKPDKSKSRERIDGIVALIMGLDRATRNLEQKSVYEDQDIKVL